MSHEDDLWFVMDVDRWSPDQLREIAQYCQQYPNWHFVLSNPCFEVWLYFHKKSEVTSSAPLTCGDFKYEISKFDIGGYHPLTFLPHLQEAISNAAAADIDSNHYMPGLNQTKVYRLGESILQRISEKDFQAFINNTIPAMIKADKEKFQLSKRIK